MNKGTAALSLALAITMTMIATACGGDASDGSATGKNSGRSAEIMPGLRQTVLQRFDVPGTAYETILMRVEFPPGYEVERHAHPGPQASLVLQGAIIYKFDGAEPQARSAGASMELPGYAVHGATVGPEGVVLLNTFVVEKGKPLSFPPP